MSDQGSPSDKRTRKAIACLTFGAVCTFAAHTAISHVLEASRVLKGVLDTPGKVVFAEHALGIRDGLADQGVEMSAYDERLARIEEARDAQLSLALAPVYEDGYDRASAGIYGPDNLEAYLAAIETNRAELLDQLKVLDSPRWTVATVEPLATAEAYGLDANDQLIYEAFWSARAKAEEIGGEGSGEAIFQLMMSDVAHDQLREAFSQDTGVPSYGEEAQQSMAGFLTATGIYDNPFDGNQVSAHFSNLEAGPGARILTSYNAVLENFRAEREPEYDSASAEGIGFAF